MLQKLEFLFVFFLFEFSFTVINSFVVRFFLMFKGLIPIYRQLHVYVNFKRDQSMYLNDLGTLTFYRYSHV